jgi:hypothetical protein
MAFTGSRGHCIDPHGNLPAIAAEDLTLPQQDVALGVVYSGTVTGGIPEVRLPDSDGEKPAGVVYGKSYDADDQISMATKGRVWMVAAEAISNLNDRLMLDDATGYVLLATAEAEAIGCNLTTQASVGGLVLVDLQLGTVEQA